MNFLAFPWNVENFRRLHSVCTLCSLQPVILSKETYPLISIAIALVLSKTIGAIAPKYTVQYSLSVPTLFAVELSFQKRNRSAPFSNTHKLSHYLPLPVLPSLPVLVNCLETHPNCKTPMPDEGKNP